MEEKRSEINGMGLKVSSRLKSAEEDKSGTLKSMLGPENREQTCNL